MSQQTAHAQRGTVGWIGRDLADPTAGFADPDQEWRRSFTGLSAATFTDYRLHIVGPRVGAANALGIASFLCGHGDMCGSPAAQGDLLTDAAARPSVPPTSMPDSEAADRSQ